MLYKVQYLNILITLAIFTVVLVAAMILIGLPSQIEEHRIVVDWHSIEIRTPSKIHSPVDISISNELNVNLEISKNDWIDKYRLRGDQIAFTLTLFVNEIKIISNATVYTRILNPNDIVFGETEFSLQLLPVSTYHLPFSFLINTGTEIGRWKAEFFLCDSCNSTKAFDMDIIRFEVVGDRWDIVKSIISKAFEKPLVTILTAVLSIASWAGIGAKVKEYTKKIRGLTAIVIFLFLTGLFIFILYLFSFYLTSV